MSIIDISELVKLIKFKIDHGLEIDTSICKDFEKNTRHKNLIFTNGIDLIYEIFHLDNKMKNNIISNVVKYLGGNKTLNGIFKKFADRGLNY